MVPTRNPIPALVLVTAVGVLATGCGAGQPGVAKSGNTVPTTPSSSELAQPTTTTAPPTTTASTPPTSTEEPPSATLFTAPANAVSKQNTRCNAGVLTAQVRNINAGAGQRKAQFVVTNTGASACTLYGYGGFALVGADGKAVPTNLKWVANPGPSLVSLAPGRSAAMNLRWSVVPDGSESDTGPCEPTAVKIESIPPDETEPMQSTWTFGQVCSEGSMEGSAFYPA